MFSIDGAAGAKQNARVLRKKFHQGRESQRHPEQVEEINLDPSGFGEVPSEIPSAPRGVILPPQQSPQSTHTHYAPVDTAGTATSMSKNILSSDVSLKGTIRFSNELVLDGKVDGEILSEDGHLTIGENAKVKGEVKTKGVIVLGKVEGNMMVKERCDLRANAQIIGDIKAGTLAIEEGATFVGQSSVGAAATASGGGPGPGGKPSAGGAPQAPGGQERSLAPTGPGQGGQGGGGQGGSGQGGSNVPGAGNQPRKAGAPA
ncbi:MAG TPA: polymer-forming cytoskeletal protein [Verrucomicrobiales bacterium]|nr:polymer-forming cytoskeletal protein [Verrucomicrobiales bacterium]